MVATLLAAVAAAGVAVAVATAELNLRRERDRSVRARERVLVVADAVQRSYADRATLPASLGELTRNGYLDASATLDPWAPTTALRLTRAGGARGTLTVWSAGRNRANERGAGDDVAVQVAGSACAATLTNARARQIERGVAARLATIRTRASLSGTNASGFAALDAEVTWLDAHRDDADWPVRLSAWLGDTAQLVQAAAAASGRTSTDLDALVAAVQADATAVAAWSSGNSASRGALTAAAIAARALGVGARRWGIAAALAHDDVAVAFAAGHGAALDWRARVADRVPGLTERALAAVLEAQDGDAGLQHPLAGARNANVAVRRLGFTVAMARDGWARALRVEPAPTYGLRSAGADGRFNTADDLVFAEL